MQNQMVGEEVVEVGRGELEWGLNLILLLHVTGGIGCEPDGGGGGGGGGKGGAGVWPCSQARDSSGSNYWHSC